MGEKIDAQERDEIGQALAEAGGQLQVAQQQYRDQCCPNLRLDGVGRGAEEDFDFQVLLERFEKQPAILGGWSDLSGCSSFSARRVPLPPRTRCCLSSG